MENRIEKIELQDKSIFYVFKNDYITQKIKNNNNYYEAMMLTKFKEYIPREAVIYDIGANIGNHTIYFSKYTNPKKIYSFEPVEEVYNVLIKNIESNNISNAQAFNVAVGHKECNVSMEVCSENFGGNRVVKDDNGDVKLIVLDNMNLDAPNFVKIDVEEFELKVLLGMKETLMKYKPIIWIEVFKDKFQVVNQFLNDIGYEIVERIESNCIYKVPVDECERKNLHERFKNNIVNYYEEVISSARNKYRSTCETLNKTKDKLNSANVKYKQVTVNYSDLKNKIDSKDLTLKKHELIKKLQQDNLKKEKLIHNYKSNIENFEKETDELKRANKEKEEVIEELMNEKHILENSIGRLKIENKNNLQGRNSEIEMLSNKALMYMDYIEKLMYENEELKKKRKYLIDRTETLYSNNQMLVKELKNFKARYKALRGSKLGKITVLFWKLKRRGK